MLAVAVSPNEGGDLKVDNSIITEASKIYTCGLRSPVALKALPAANYVFDRWGGSLTGSVNPTSVTLPATVTAYFIPDAEREAVNYSGAKDLIDSSKILVIDLSSSSDYAKGHILCAKNYIWNDTTQNFSSNITNLNLYKYEDILLYDQYGSLSENAAIYLNSQLFGSGDSKIYYMTDGLDDWIAEGYETYTTAEDAGICTSLPPMAYAGFDQNVNENANMKLRGRGEDPDGGSVTYKWSQVQGINNVNLSSTTIAQPSFTTPDLNGGDDTLIFLLTVTDDDDDKDTDSVTVNINWNNAPPSADAGTDQTVSFGALVTLIGSGSSDPENSIVSYQWAVISGTIMPPVLSNNNSATPNLTAPDRTGFIIYQLTVTDSGGLTHSDTVKITTSSSGSGSSTPVAPTGLAANAVSYRKIMLRWTDQSPDKNSSFKIERKKKYCSDDTYDWTEIATVQSDEKAKNYEDVGEFELGMKYSYRVRAYSGSDNSEYSNCASIIDPMPSASGTPSAPVNLVATYSSKDIIDLSWDQWGSTVTKFEIYRDENNSGSWTLLATNASDVLTYSDTTARNNQTTSFYIYKVQACNDAGCSPPAYKVGVPFNPTDLSATVNAQNKIVLQWTDNSDAERGFEIYRKIGGCSSSASWEKVKQAGISRETVTAGSATSGTYSYKIRAYYRSRGIPYVYGYSSWSDCYEIVAP